MKMMSQYFVLIILMLSLAACAVDSSTSFHVDKLWSDSQYIFVLVRRNYTLEYATLLNIHGDVLIDKNDFTYLKLNKNKIVSGDEIDLTRGEPADALIYIDSDFIVEKNYQKQSEINFEAIVSNRNDKFTITCDSRQWNSRDTPLRMDDKLIYCGNIIPVVGNEIIKFPELLKKKIEQQFEKSGSGYARSETKLAFNEGKILFFVRDEFGSKQNGLLEFLMINPDTLEVAGTGNLPFQKGEYQIYPDTGYFRHGFVIMNNEKPNVIYACDLEKCREFNLNEFDFYVNSSALFVEDSGNEMILLTSQSKFLGGERYKVRLVKAEVTHLHK